MMNSSIRTTIAVVICTYNRNEALTTLLEALLACVRIVKERAAIGVVVVDDSTDERARAVVARFEGQFELGITYCYSGQQNISGARNLAIETGSKMADWTTMIDDDCEPMPEWLAALLDVQQRTGADAVTGPMIRRVPAGSPTWLTGEPFLELSREHNRDRFEDGAQLAIAWTGNSMISSRWLKNHPTIRFLTELGVTSGEDAVFFRTAQTAGLRIHWSQRAIVYENEPPSRATLSYQLRSFFWYGNTSYVTSTRTGTPPIRMFLHGLYSLGKAFVRPIVRLFRGERPQLRYCLALVLLAIGVIIGFFGIRLNHPL
jgi:succinoglycan biosynthesis protein ExoM